MQTLLLVCEIVRTIRSQLTDEYIKNIYFEVNPNAKRECPNKVEKHIKRYRECNVLDFLIKSPKNFLSKLIDSYNYSCMQVQNLGYVFIQSVEVLVEYIQFLLNAEKLFSFEVCCNLWPEFNRERQDSSSDGETYVSDEDLEQPSVTIVNHFWKKYTEECGESIDYFINSLYGDAKVKMLKWILDCNKN